MSARRSFASRCCGLEARTGWPLAPAKGATIKDAWKTLAPASRHFMSVLIVTLLVRNAGYSGRTLDEAKSSLPRDEAAERRRQIAGAPESQFCISWDLIPYTSWYRSPNRAADRSCLGDEVAIAP